jgi:RNA polymerase sigma factor (sigma-70 family)
MRVNGMNDVRSGPVLRQLEVLFRSGTVAGMGDGQLLECFAVRRDAQGEIAFAALVARHGPMVLGTCRQLLGDSGDADDAFQAAFLTLARKAGSIRQPDRLGAWLHGVAVRKARKLKQQRQRRRRHERRRPVGPGESSPMGSQAEHREESAALHEELARLPEKYRTPVVLCYLEGHTHETAAMVLGWPVGTVRGRLARAREQLRQRLARRGVVPAVMAVGGWPHHPLARAVVSTSLAEATVHAATPGVGRWTWALARLAGTKAIGAGVMRSTAVRLAAVLVIAGGSRPGRLRWAVEPSSRSRGPGLWRGARLPSPIARPAIAGRRTVSPPLRSPHGSLTPCAGSSPRPGSNGPSASRIRRTSSMSTSAAGPGHSA